MQIKSDRHTISRFIGALSGAVIYGVSINLFIVPAGLYSGGIMGFCQVIRTILADFLKLPIANFDIAGLIYYLTNIPIFIIGFNKMGKHFFFKSLLCVTVTTVSMSVTPIPNTPLLSNDILATCIIAGIINGIGIGMMLTNGGSGGGMDIISIVLIKKKADFTVGQLSLFVNIALYMICLFLFDIPTVLYSLIFAAITSVATDRVHTQNINVEVNIITKKDCPEMEEEIFQELGRGITKWVSEGAYTKEESRILYILLSKYEVGHLKHIIRKYDSEAFIVVNEGVKVEGHYLKKL